ncbi:hypothetical protein F0562_015467 [Nyssa sinensis]|uniref:GAG-pre-integrase domain-containing protein n=1 Tax=Nyssa sinensis TaxID=561372 RepID=A0A5J4ZH49_9ASTE|nr:hypothetical protein F0562_015467 [Nyssa sinensis]
MIKFIWVMDLRTWRTIMEGPVRNNLYPIPTRLFGQSHVDNKASSVNKELAAVSSQKGSQTLWHRRLGHPSP